MKKYVIGGLFPALFPFFMNRLISFYTCCLVGSILPALLRLFLEPAQLASRFCPDDDGKAAVKRCAN